MLSNSTKKKEKYENEIFLFRNVRKWQILVLEKENKKIQQELSQKEMHVNDTFRKI